ncbi:asparaginase [uncultured Castellaniella sp.]|uniref:asparaginase n=1 Tax=uncultured Castellaniella sp. TaxID=647907 RepID=UPI00260A80DD|nr:asparaginase [uncultured Castellaniella sp.]
MRRRLLLIGTGGTIAATADAHRLTDYQVTEGIDSMLAAIPGAGDLAAIRCEQPFNVDSRALRTAQVLQLARRVSQAVQDDTVDGIVITHGTDSLEETAFLLHLTVRTPKPVVLTGAMRPASAPSADGPLNLINALLTARDPASEGRGVLIAMNDLILAARQAAKGHTTRVDAFGGDGVGVLGSVCDGQVRYRQRPDPLTAPALPLAGLRSLPLVDIIQDYQDAPPHPYQAAIQAGARGIVVAGMGNGSLSQAAERGCAQARRKGLICVRASHVPRGPVTAKASDADSGLLASHELNPLQARIALRLALAHGWDRDAIGALLRQL